MSVLDSYNRWLNSSKVSEEYKKLLKNMTNEDIDDAFFKNIEFGTGGMRGVLGPGTNRLNEFTVTKASVGFAKYLLEKYENVKTDGVVISHDNRHMSREFTLLTAKVLSEFGIKVYIFDALRPTPELSYAVRRMKASGGIMITASHNPKEHNGYKVYDETGCQLVPEKIARLLEIIDSLPNELEVEYTPVAQLGEIITLPAEIDDEYVELVKSVTLNNDLNKKGFKIVFTPNHGTAYVNGMRVFNELGYDIYPLLSQCNPDPNFSNTLSPNPEDTKAFIEPIKYAKEIGAHLIVMTDPDGDRCGLAYLDNDGEYKTLTGNQSAAMLMDYIFSVRKERGLLHDNGVMYNTIVTSALGESVATHYGVKTEQFLTGFKFIGDRIGHYESIGEEHFFEFGYEESYGCLIADFVRDKDAIQAIVMYSEMALYYHLQGKNLGDVWNDLGKKFGCHIDELYSVYFKGSKGQEIMTNIMNSLRNDPFITLDGIKVVKVEDYVRLTSTELGKQSTTLNYPKSDVIKLYFEDKSTIALRPSGTEAKLKTYIGTVDTTYELAKEKVKTLYTAIQKLLNI